jgi:hypothetical protein
MLQSVLAGGHLARTIVGNGQQWLEKMESCFV